MFEIQSLTRNSQLFPKISENNGMPLYNYYN